MRKQKHIFALVCCLFFLLGNIYFDWADTPDNPADGRIFFIPMSVMIFSLILLCDEYSPEKLKPYWWVFIWLSIGQIIKFIGFNPYVKMLSDYAFLAIIIIGFIYKIRKNARQLTAGNN